MTSAAFMALALAAGSASAQPASSPPAELTGEAVLARADRLRESVAAMREEITRVSRDPSLPEPQRAARIESLSAGVERESDALAEMVDQLMQARKAEAQRLLKAAAPR